MANTINRGCNCCGECCCIDSKIFPVKVNFTTTGCCSHSITDGVILDGLGKTAGVCNLSNGSLLNADHIKNPCTEYFPASGFFMVLPFYTLRRIVTLSISNNGYWGTEDSTADWVCAAEEVGKCYAYLRVETSAIWQPNSNPRGGQFKNSVKIFRKKITNCSDICGYGSWELCYSKFRTDDDGSTILPAFCEVTGVSVDCTCPWKCSGSPSLPWSGVNLDWPSTTCVNDTTYSFTLADAKGCKIKFNEDYYTSWVDGTVDSLTGCTKDGKPCISFQGSLRFHVQITTSIVFNTDGSVTGTIELTLTLEGRYRTYQGACPQNISSSPWINMDMYSYSPEFQISPYDLNPAYKFKWTFASNTSTGAGKCSDAFANWIVRLAEDGFTAHGGSPITTKSFIWNMSWAGQDCDGADRSLRSDVSIPCDPRNPTIGFNTAI